MWLGICAESVSSEIESPEDDEPVDLRGRATAPVTAFSASFSEDDVVGIYSEIILSSVFSSNDRVI
jgi:hypothetical protein